MKGGNFEEMKKKKEKEAILLKGNDIVLFVKEKTGIKLVNLDLRKEILLNEPKALEIEA